MAATDSSGEVAKSPVHRVGLISASRSVGPESAPEDGDSAHTPEPPSSASRGRCKVCRIWTRLHSDGTVIDHKDSSLLREYDRCVGSSDYPSEYK